VTAILLLAWPALAAPWERVWSSAPRPRHHQPWWPYLVAASLPIGVLLLSLVPLQASLPEATQEQPTGLCAQFTSWALGGGLTEENNVTTDLGQLQLAGGKSATAADARQLDAAIRAALDNPPPGAARSSYTTEMTDYGTAPRDMQAGNLTAAINAVNDGANQEARAGTLMAGQCTSP
jgi:hypothetical protein